MAWVTPTTVNTGDVLTASEWNQSVVANSLMGNPVFTTEAARNAAISSPVEGQMCYLTAPTEPSGTGMTITGIRQVYDGAAWTTVSPICGLVTTSEAYSTTAYGDLATVGPTVSIRTGNSAIVTLSATFDTVAINRGATMGFAVSGATTIAAADDNSIFAFTNTGQLFAAASRTFLLTGLTAGVNTFTSKYKEQGGVVNIFRRSITVCGAA